MKHVTTCAVSSKVDIMVITSPTIMHNIFVSLWTSCIDYTLSNELYYKWYQIDRNSETEVDQRRHSKRDGQTNPNSTVELLVTHLPTAPRNIKPAAVRDEILKPVKICWPITVRRENSDRQKKTKKTGRNH